MRCWRLVRSSASRLADTRCLDSLRLEKGYRYYTADVTQLETPYEAGLGFCVDLDKGDFIGKAGTGQAEAGRVETQAMHPGAGRSEIHQIYGGEEFITKGKVISRVRSGGYGYTMKKNILYAYLPVELAKTGTRLEVDLIEGRFQAEVTPGPV